MPCDKHAKPAQIKWIRTGHRCCLVTSLREIIIIGKRLGISLLGKGFTCTEISLRMVVIYPVIQQSIFSSPSFSGSILTDPSSSRSSVLEPVLLQKWHAAWQSSLWPRILPSWYPQASLQPSFSYFNNVTSYIFKLGIGIAIKISDPLEIVCIRNNPVSKNPSHSRQQ